MFRALRFIRRQFVMLARSCCLLTRKASVCTKTMSFVYWKCIGCIRLSRLNAPNHTNLGVRMVDTNTHCVISMKASLASRVSDWLHACESCTSWTEWEPFEWNQYPKRKWEQWKSLQSFRLLVLQPAYPFPPDLLPLHSDYFLEARKECK